MKTMPFLARQIVIPSLVLLATLPVTAQVPADREPANGLSAAVVRLLSWRLHWLGDDAFPRDYAAGRVVQAKVLQSGGEFAVFLSDLHLNVGFTSLPDGLVIPTGGLGWMAGETNEAAAKRYLASMGTSPECVTVIRREPSGKVTAPPGKTVPAARACLAPDPINGYTEYVMPVTLPTAPAPAIPGKMAPPRTAKTVIPLAKELLDDYSEKGCSKNAAHIPFFNDTDPRIYVLLDGCEGRGLHLITRNKAGWELEYPYMPYIPGREAVLDRIVRLILANPMTTLRANPKQ